MSTQLERLASLETSVKHFKGIALIFVPLLIGWGAYITLNVISIKQSLLDGGNTKLVAQLEKPASTQQLQANLNTVIAQVQTARVNRIKANFKKISVLSDAVSQVVVNEPNLPEGWEAAAQLITYRTGDFITAQNKVPCETEGNVPHVVVTGGPAVANMLGDVSFSNCVLDLDRPDLWTSINSTVHISAQDGEIISNWHLELHNVIVHYSGTPLIHVSQIVFDHCMFDFYFNAPPASSPGRSLTQQLLATTDVDMLEVHLPTA